jgi:hypothetical protein
VILAFDFAINDYVGDEALFMRVLIGFFASIAVFVGLLATALIRSGRSGSQIDQVFFVGVVLAVLGALVGLTFPGGAGMSGFVVGGVGMLLMGIGAIRS